VKVYFAGHVLPYCGYFMHVFHAPFGGILCNRWGFCF